MEEAADQPPHMILLDPYFVVYRGRRLGRCRPQRTLRLKSLELLCVWA